MQSSAKTVEEYISQLPSDRVEPIRKLREVILKNIPKGFVEEMGYGMIGYVIPHSLYPGGYHCNPILPVPFVNIASQKNSINLYHMGIYASAELLEWFVREYPKHCSSKMDMGKSCIRFKNFDDIPYELIGELMKKVTVEKWIEIYSRFDPRNKK